MRGRAVYFDHNATTPLAPEVLDAMLPHLRDTWGNPSSVHRFGVEARYAIEKARRQIALAMDVVNPERLIFTRGGTDSINLAIRGAARRAKRLGRGRHLITSAAEHHAVLDTCRDLATNEGFDLTVLPVDRWSRVRPDDLRAAIRPDTVLVSLMTANNETGALNPVEHICSIVKNANPLTILHTDAIQAAGKIPLNLGQLSCDLVSFGAHKANGPKGIGALVLGGGVEIDPLETGGGQESGLVPGTENVALIVGLAAAIRKSVEHLDSEAARLTGLREQLWDVIQTVEPAAVRNSPEEDCLPGTLNVSFPGFSGQRLVAELDGLGYAVSAGSACTSRGTVVSHVISAAVEDEAIRAGAVRFSMGLGNSEAEITGFGEVLKKALALLR